MSPPGVEPVLPSWKISVVTTSPPSRTCLFIFFHKIIETITEIFAKEVKLFVANILINCTNSSIYLFIVNYK